MYGALVVALRSRGVLMKLEAAPTEDRTRLLGVATSQYDRLSRFADKALVSTPTSARSVGAAHQATTSFQQRQHHRSPKRSGPAVGDERC